MKSPWFIVVLTFITTIQVVALIIENILHLVTDFRCILFPSLWMLVLSLLIICVIHEMGDK